MERKRISEDIIEKIVKEKKKGKAYSYLANKYKVPAGSIATWVRRYNYTGSSSRGKVGRRKTSKSMTIEELRKKFPDIEPKTINNAVVLAKSKGLITKVERGKYAVKKD